MKPKRKRVIEKWYEVRVKLKHTDGVYMYKHATKAQAILNYRQQKGFYPKTSVTIARMTRESIPV